ncbi:hypothetical protein HX021_18230 [Sphingobacterium sp. N143]|uniref:hypothetical protein n=1 Tax=Sphingobacterium sp. N143 TaxID=2746727 RepID=UPI002575FC38|nr:hypothetical protein [Sphingobacterium sp. N143]MDM1296226.1 hypothetical protein [Sphingobacterium sp. N143]
MLFIYSIYDFVLAEKPVITTLKKESSPKHFTLQIITPARKFLGLPFGGGFVKLSRLYDETGKLIHARNYSDELKTEIKAFKKDYDIPYFQLWKGFLFVFAAILVWAAIYGIKNKIGNQTRENETARMIENLQHLKPGQLYGATFFTDHEGNSINGVPAGWIKIDKIVGDTVFVQRSKKIEDSAAVFDMDNIAAIKPQSPEEWEDKIEKMDYKLLTEQLQEANKKSVDVVYIGQDHEKYAGVIFTIKGTE